MHGKFIVAPDGLKGFDCNAIISPEVAALFRCHGYRFAIRYVKRAIRNPQDITATEANDILKAGLGLMLVQHVAPEGWAPTPMLGGQYGRTASAEAYLIGYPKGAILWCDLEGVNEGAHPESIIGFCNEWYSAVKAIGYQPGLYVGYGAGLSAKELYSRLKFTRYWSAYNLNADAFPAVRGVQMRQGSYPGPIPGVKFEFDTDVTHADALGSRVSLFVDNEWTP